MLIFILLWTFSERSHTRGERVGERGGERERERERDGERERERDGERERSVRSVFARCRSARA